ncbi:MAG TPA: hypothetical protein PLX33_08915 [Alphaproteobacteria bacterium]|nr:hypothetical protein [Alphaproteobacteria bacterium]
MNGHSAMLRDLFPQAAPLFDAAEDNSRARCDNALACMKLTHAEKVAAVHIAAESGSYEAADYLLQTFAKDKGAVKLLSATHELAKVDPALTSVISRYSDALHSQTMAKIEAVHKLIVT